MAKRICCILLFVAMVLVSVVFAIGWKIESEENIYLQSNIDMKFSHAFSELCSLLFYTDIDGMPENVALKCYRNMEGYGKVCETMLPLSSYQSNSSLKSILDVMLKCIPGDATYDLEIIGSHPEFLDKLGRFSLELSSKVLADELWYDIQQILE